MFSETEFLINRNEFLYEERCKVLSNLINSLVANPEIPVITDDFYDQARVEIKAKVKLFCFCLCSKICKLSKFIILKIKIDDLVVDLTLVSAILFWEVLHFLGLNSWNNTNFNLEICIKKIENSKDFVSMILAYFFWGNSLSLKKFYMCVIVS